jgi:REP element-mobilizing transposase RayT
MSEALFNPQRTAWHITVGTYCARLHGDGRPTVDRRHNQRGEAFITHDADRAKREQDRARGEPVQLSQAQRELIEEVLPEICERGGWTLHACAAPPPPENDHVHILLDAPPDVHGKDIRKWLKRWLSDALDAGFGRPESGNWWVDGGSTKPVKELRYFENVLHYIRKQRTTKRESLEHAP